MTIRYLDLVNGNDANDGTTFALRKKTLFSATQGQGDTVRVMASPEPTSMGQSATFTNGSDTITLTTAVTANIDTCETAWTASANVTATAQSTIQREGTNAASLVVASAFTTGLIAYHALGAAQDFSAYQQVSFLIRQSGKYGTLAASSLSLQLCSDAAGTVPVHSFTLPLLGDSCWTALVFDNAAALGSSIQSIALYALLDPGALTIAIDNVIACKAKASPDSLTHQSLISKNTGTEPWMAIDSINGTTIKLAGGYQTAAARTNYTPYYWGTTATQTLYKREPILLDALQSVYSACKIEGGWDRTAMTTQNGKTFVRAINPGIAASSAIFSATYISKGSLNNWYSVNAQGKGFDMSSGWTLGEVGAIACGVGLLLYQTGWVEAFSDAIRYFVHCINAITTSGPPTSGNARLRIGRLWGVYNGSSQYIALSDNSSDTSSKTLELFDCDIQQFFAAFGNQYATTGVFNYVVFSNCTFANLNRLLNTGVDDVQLIGCPAVTIGGGASNSIIKQTRIGGDPTQNKTVFSQYRGNGTVESSTEQRHTASDFAWKVTSASNVTFSDPISFLLAKIACVANELRTVKLWVYRGDANAIFRLRLKGGYLTGIDQDLTTVLPAGTATWIQLAIEFTPTGQGVAEVFAEGGGGVGSTLWIDDLEVL